MYIYKLCLKAAGFGRLSSVSYARRHEDIHMSFSLLGISLTNMGIRIHIIIIHNYYFTAYLLQCMCSSSILWVQF